MVYGNPKIFGGYQKIAEILRKGAIGVIPTDTLYGICASVSIGKSIEEVYKLKKRKTNRPMIILISSIDDLRKFKIKLNNKQEEILTKLWPGKISVILNCPYQEFKYLHRGRKTLAFRLPKNKFIAKILKISGPLVAPSANWEDFEPAKNITEAKKYFGNKIFYSNKGNLISKPSTLIDLTRDLPKVIRKGSDFAKVKSLLSGENYRQKADFLVELKNERTK